MKNLIFLLVVIGLSSCVTPQSLHLVNIYQDKPFVIYSEKSKDEVWSKVIDIFAQKGLAINVIDKSSGLIGSNEYSFGNSMTYEMENGMPNDTTAWVIVNKYTSTLGNIILPNTIKGSFNVRVKEEGNKTAININLVNLTAWYLHPSGSLQIPYEIKSTGKFEQSISDLLK